VGLMINALMRDIRWAKLVVDMIKETPVMPVVVTAVEKKEKKKYQKKRVLAEDEMETRTKKMIHE